MYQAHFGLGRPPFKITPDTSLFFEGSQRGAALDALIYTVTSGEGIIKVVGEVGSGKTMLCRMLEVRLAGKVDVVYIANPSLSPDNILHVIAHELGLEIDSGSNKLDVMQKLHTYLLKKHADNRQVVLFVEEAQSMPIETLEEIRLLSNLETEHSKLLQMVLFGQPELDEKLAQSQIRQLKERITHSFYLDPFPPEDTLEYLNFRLRNVGYRGPDVFDQKTANAIEKYSGGLIRRINILADKALMASFSEGGHEVTTKHVRTGAVDSDFKKKLNVRRWLAVAAVAAGLVVAVWFGTIIAPLEREAPTGATRNEVTAAPGQAPAKTIGTRIPETNSPLASRLRATENWLAIAPDSRYSIQLLMTRVKDVQGIEKFLSEWPEMLELDQVYIYETIIDETKNYSVLYGDFESYQVALAQLRSLPDKLKSSRPFLRRLSAVRKDLIRNQAL
ncbi:MAG: AAA family ATPase [Gammaproteobacteria bacterium]|nr:AAA family ATPase [Gammaproteobacteria bacterium]